MAAGQPSILVLYHYYHPDDVVSARHFADLCEGLARRGWQVTVRPCNRGCRDESKRFQLRDEWQGVRICRVWRPALRQASSLGRIVNALWMLAAWSLAAFSYRRPDVLLVGTDPILSVLVARVWRLFRPRVRIAHWCFDLYPEAMVAANLLMSGSWLDRLLRRLARSAYRCCDLIADLGPCMRARLEKYGKRPAVTLVPWALVEPDQPAASDETVRKSMFGDARLALLYSGNFGHAHSYQEIVELARRLRGDDIPFGFAVRGNRANELKQAVGPEDRNIRFLPFVEEKDLPVRLAAADVHLVSLRPEWSGVVVPSKFFGSLAIGRPVLFAGPTDCAIARWIEQFGLGWVLTAENIDAVADDLRKLSSHPEQLAGLQQRCHAVYHEHFARETVLDRWDDELRRTLR